MTLDTMQRLAAETRRERLREAEHARLVAKTSPGRTPSFGPRFAEAVGHLRAAHRRPVAR